MGYRVRMPFVAVRSGGDGTFRFVSIEAGTVITVKGQTQHSGLVEIHYGGETVAAFMRDIEDRCERIE